MVKFLRITSQLWANARFHKAVQTNAFVLGLHSVTQPTFEICEGGVSSSPGFNFRDRQIGMGRIEAGLSFDSRKYQFVLILQVSYGKSCCFGGHFVSEFVYVKVCDLSQKWTANQSRNLKSRFIAF